jgi:hypothetical protein
VASYSGDPSFNPSSSAPFTFTIVKAATLSETAINASSLALGSSVTLNVVFGVVTAVAPGPTGSVTFSFGSTVLGTAPLTPCWPTLYMTSYLCSVTDEGFSLATVSTSSLPLGTDTITASYGGDANFNPATATFSVRIGEPATVTAIANPVSINQLESSTITATVTGISGMATPTGTVAFDAIGGGTTWSAYGYLVNGSASFNFGGNGFRPGNIAVQVSYEGDSTYAGVATVIVPFVVTPPFTLTGTPVAVVAGASTGNTSTITVTPLSGFTGTVALLCALTSSPAGAQHLPTCSTSSAPVITGTSAATVTMTVYSTGTTTSGALHLPPTNLPGPWRLRWLGVNGAVTLAGLLLLGIPVRGRRRRLLLGLLFILVFGSFSGCGGSGGSTVTVPGTTAGNYTFTLIGTSQGVSASGTVTVTIQ